MKKITFILLFSLAFSTFSFSQSTGTFQEELRLAVGVNAIQNLGTREPFTDIDEWSFSVPFFCSFRISILREMGC